MTTPRPHSQDRPARWLRELAQLHPVRWPWGRSLRAAFCVAAPLAIGLETRHLPLVLWLSLAAMITAGSEGEGTYRSRFRQLAIATPIAATGFFAGYLATLPWPTLIAAMAALAFLSAIVSSYGAAFSTGAMQALVYASIAIGLPETGPPWQSAGLYAAGVAFYAAMLGLEALIDRRRPQRTLLANYIAALARFAHAQSMEAARDLKRVGENASMRMAAAPDAETARRAVTDQSRALYAALLEARRTGRTRELVNNAGVLDAADSLFSGIVATRDVAALAKIASWLADLSAAVRRRAPAPPALPGAEGLVVRAARFAATIKAGGLVRASGDDVAETTGSRGALSSETDTATPEENTAKSRGRPAGWFNLGGIRAGLLLRMRHLAVGRETLVGAAALALCMGLAFAMKPLVADNHWYWIPLTVAIVMKPDFGSVFVRAVLRSAGASIGVIIGAAIMILLPKGVLLVIVIAVLAALTPWAKGVSYGVQTVALTPLVLILLDLMAPTPLTVDYGMQRFVDTLIAGGIVLVFGYFIWPRSHARQLAADVAAAMAALADYLEAASGPADDGAADRAGRSCYVRLSDLRVLLGRSMAEPPPAGREAAAWFPAIAGAERICDHITAYLALRQADHPPLPANEVAAVAARLRSITGTGGEQDMPAPAITTAFLEQIMEEAGQIAQRVEAWAPAAPASA